MNSNKEVYSVLKFTVVVVLLAVLYGIRAREDVV